MILESFMNKIIEQDIFVDCLKVKTNSKSSNNEKLKKMLEKKAQELHISLNRLMWNYINRGLMGDNVDEEKFIRYHSEEYLKEVNEALGLD